jgi:hypothetical protein
VNIMKSLLTMELLVSAAAATLSWSSASGTSLRHRTAVAVAFLVHASITGGRRWQMWPAAVALVVVACSRVPHGWLASLGFKATIAGLSALSAGLAVTTPHPELLPPTGKYAGRIGMVDTSIRGNDGVCADKFIHVLFDR